MVASYAILFRISVIPLVMHQLYATYFFVNAYSTDDNAFKRFSNTAFFLVTILAALLFCVAILNPILFGQAFYSVLNSSGNGFLFLIISTPFWSLIAMNELSFSKKNSPFMPLLQSILAFTIIASLSTFYLQYAESLAQILKIVSLSICAYATVNSVLFRLAKVPVPSSPIWIGFIVIFVGVCTF